MCQETDKKEIEITPQMIKAGEVAICGFNAEYDDVKKVVKMIYEAMVLAKSRACEQ